MLNNFRNDGELVYEASVPDTITSWVIDVFSIQKDVGIGFAPESAKVHHIVKCHALPKHVEQ